MSNELNGKRIAVLVANSGVEQVELTTQWEGIEKAGGTPVLIAPEKNTVQAFNNDVEKADTFDVDVAVAQPAGLQGDATQVQLLTLHNIRPAAVAAGLATDAELEELERDLRTYVDRPDTVVTTARIVQSWGTKPVP